jgi:YegS/Rv2252/BmrU family lipid kinase
VAVVAHAGKSFGGGLQELRKVLDAAGHPTPLWYEVQKSKKAPRAIRRALRDGADLVYVWGGDGMVQHCIDAMADADRKVPIAILPAGTANLLANNLGIPIDIAQAVDLGLAGVRQPLDVGVVNGERFAVMAGTGVDAITMRDVSTEGKERLGRLAYFRSGVNALRKDPVPMTIRVNGKAWFTGEASCVLVGNVGTIAGDLKPFPDASPVDGKLEVAVVTANTKMDWARVFARLATGHADRSPFVRTTRATKIVVALEEEAPYELDGGDRGLTSKLKFRVEPGAITVCVPVALSVTRRSSKKGRRPRPKVGSAQAATSLEVAVEAPGVGAETLGAAVEVPGVGAEAPGVGAEAPVLTAVSLKPEELARFEKLFARVGEVL